MPQKQGATSTGSLAEGKAKIVRIEPVRPRIALSEEILYKILVAEIAGQRGRLDISMENYLDLARMTRDPKIVERATRIAVYIRNIEAATEAARLWIKLDPWNPDAHRVLAVMALRQGDIDETLEHLRYILEASHGDLSQKLMMVVNLLGREKNKELVMTVMQQLLAGHEDDPEAMFAFASIAARMGEPDRALTLLERVLEMAPDNDNATMSYISILQKQGRINDALKWLEDELPKRDSNDFNLRMAYARLLTDTKRYDDARRQFEILAVSAPNNEDVLYALGLLYLQSNRLDEAETYFKRLSELNNRSSNVKYYLGRIAEERKDYKQARIWYQGVQDGENYFDARLRIGLLNARNGDINSAREYLKTIKTNGPKEETVLVQTEAEILIDKKRYVDAMAVFDEALEGKYNVDLLYSRAMLAEKMGRIDILEQDLRSILAKEPDNDQALNALGYTLADRTDRYQEAYDLIRKALLLKPSDFYVLDSMGWVLYRLGRHDEAIEYLRKAMKLSQDPEIAAHLGEVLWAKGDEKTAQEIWETALQTTPEDTHLIDVIKRFSPKKAKH
ncbi:MAG: tetratricopeptide repeat protein [Gammaproteobacteria bacterium]